MDKATSSRAYTLPVRYGHSHSVRVLVDGTLVAVMAEYVLNSIFTCVYIKTVILVSIE